MAGWITLLLLWFVVLAVCLCRARQSTSFWVVLVGCGGVYYCLVLWRLAPLGAPYYVWPLLWTACVTIAVGLVCTVFHYSYQKRVGRDREQGPQLPGADAMRLWRERRRRTSTDVQAERKPPSDIKS